MEWNSMRLSKYGSSPKDGERKRIGNAASSVSVSVGNSDCNGGELGRYSMLDQVKMPSSRYRGVVRQHNGRWGAQIYEKHQRIWLGTFNSEENAAIAYDRAALKLRGLDTITNFRPAARKEPGNRFPTEHTKKQIVEMLRNHTFDKELLDYGNIAHNSSAPAASNTKGESEQDERNGAVNDNGSESFSSSISAKPGDSGFREHLFDKAVTPSDVGKLNRLVIPKQHAEKYFPLDRDSSDKGLLLHFEDNGGKVWMFRYSYRNTSQSYVMTKGWSRFVKAKNLQAGDIVSFHRGISPDTPESLQLYITWRHSPCAQNRPHLQSKPPLNPFQTTQFSEACNPQLVDIFWPYYGSAISHNSSVPLYFRAPSKETNCINFDNISSIRSGNLSLTIKNNISALQPGLFASKDPLQNKETLLCFEPTRKMSGVRLFGVNLMESQRSASLH